MLCGVGDDDDDEEAVMTRDVSACAFCLAFEIFGSGILGRDIHDIGKIISEKTVPGGCDCSI
jgi:hypothetical protein